MRAFIFPGQGSQSVGMGRALAEAFASAREVFEEVDDALNQRLSKLMWEGPESELTLTENTQPAVMTASIAALRVLEKSGALQLSKHARLVAGHSAGEYAALCAAGAFALPDTARLLRTRGRAMQDASPVGLGAMSALLGIEMNLVEEACKEASDVGVVVVANDNAPGQIVISGAAKAVERANELAKKKGAKRAIPLNVSTPNHSPLLKPAAEKMRGAGAHHDQAHGRAARLERHRVRSRRSRPDPKPARRTTHRPRALARVGRRVSRPRCGDDGGDGR